MVLSTIHATTAVPENQTAAPDSQEIQSFVKVAIAYLGIMAGLCVLGLGFYVMAGVNGPIIIWMQNETVVFYLVMFGLSLAGLGRLS